MLMAGFAPPDTGIKIYPDDRMLYIARDRRYAPRSALVDGVKIMGDLQGLSDSKWSQEMKAYDITLDQPYSDITCTSSAQHAL